MKDVLSRFLTDELGRKAQYNPDDMCRDAWAWQSKNPNGYDD